MANQIDKINNKVNKFKAQNTQNTQNNGKRKPSKWQLYLKECMPGQSNNIPFSDKVSACSIKYKEIKEKNPKYLDELVARPIQPTKSKVK